MYVCDDSMGGGDVPLPNARLGARGGVSEGVCAPSEAGNFYTFEIGIVQFDEYFWA